MIKNILDENPLTEQQVAYRSFYENLQSKMTTGEIQSLAVLGEDFFYLVDKITLSIYTQRTQDCLMLDLSDEQFLWELQVFTNQFLRNLCESILKLKAFCGKLKEALKDDDFQQDFLKRLEQAYQDHFFVEQSKSAYLA